MVMHNLGLPALLAWTKKVLFGKSSTLLETINSHDNNYNVLRVILAASVIWFHSSYIAGFSRPDWASRHLYPITDLGGLAVQCFFFLSGLFVAQSIYKDNNLLDYSIKRIMRIFPGLFACLVVTTVLLAMATLGPNFWHVLANRETYDYILDNGVLNLTWSIPTLIPDNPSTTINGSIHTLNTEVKMYVMLGLFGLAGIASEKRSMAGASVILLIAVAATGASITAVISAPNDACAMITMFMVGVLAFALAEKIVVSGIHGVLLLLLFFLTHKTPQIHTIVFYALAVWIMIFIGQLPSLRRWLKPRVDPSYGIYIYGWPCEQLVKVLMPSATATAVTLLAIPSAYVFALFSWRYVEKPCMDMAKSVTHKRTSWEGLVTVFTAKVPWRKNVYVLLAVVGLCLTMQFLTGHFNFQPVRTMASKIIDFGPHEASSKQGFNVQSDGRSALWVKVDTKPAKDSVIVFDGHWLDTTVDTQTMTLTAGVPAWMTSGGGNKEIWLRSVSADGILLSNTVTLKLTR